MPEDPAILDQPMTASEFNNLLSQDVLKTLSMPVREWLLAAGLGFYIDASGKLGITWDHNTGGRKQVIEDNSSNIHADLLLQAYGINKMASDQSIAGYSYSAALAQFVKKIVIKEFTLVNGALADQSLIAALASYYGVIDSILIMMPVAPNGGTIGMTFQDEDDVALLGSGGGAYTITIVANTMNTQLENIKLAQATLQDNKALEVDLDTGGGALDNGKVVVMIIIGHYET